MAPLLAWWEHSWTQIVLKEPSSGWHHVLAGWEACLGPPTLGVDLFLDGLKLTHLLGNICTLLFRGHCRKI